MEDLNKKQRYIRWFGLFCVVAVLGGYCITIGFRGMPPTEGWYTWYAELINRNEVVYKDFSYLFYPFYIQFIAFFCKIFGYKIIALRILGLLVFIAIGIATYLLFSKLVSAPGAAIAAITTTMYLQSEVVQLFYDYIRFFDLFAYLSVYFLAQYMIELKQPRKKRLSLSIIFSAVFVVLACMTKQSTGMLLIVYYLILLLFSALIFKSSHGKRILADTLCYCAVVFLLFGCMFIWLCANNAFGDFLQNATGSALAAKGGLANVLFRWIGVLYPSMRSKFAPIIGLLAIILLIVISSKIHIKKSSNSLSPEILINNELTGTFSSPKASPKENFILLAFGTLLVGILIMVCRKVHSVTKYFSDSFDGNMATFGFVLCTLCFAFIAFSLLFLAYKTRKNANISEIHQKLLPILPWFTFLGSIFAIGYGSGMSGGLCESQTALGVGFIIVLFAKAMESSKFRMLGLALLLVYGATFSTSCASRKYYSLYSWWGLSEGPVWEAQHLSKSPILSGIKMTSNEQFMYDSIIDIIENNTEKDDSIFCFPHIPIFYSLTNRKSDTYTQVQWFDVSNIKHIEQDIETLHNNPPKAIIYCELPDFVYAGHESSFNSNKKSQTRVMSDFLMSFVSKNDYTLAGEFYLCDGYTVSVYLQQ